jgi:hypothetical protein
MGIVPAKIFEAIGLGTPILVIAPSGSDVNAIADSAGLARRLSGDEIDRIARFFVEAMNGGVAALKGQEMYAWTQLAGRWDSLLRTVTGKLQDSHRSAAPAGRNIPPIYQN